jgi:hypothetical protein
MANIYIYCCFIFLSKKVIQFNNFRIFADIPLNPTASIFFQLSSWIYHQNIDILIDTWLLIVPSTIGGLCGGYFMHKFY